MDIPAPQRSDRRRLLWLAGLAIGVAMMFGLSRLSAAAPGVRTDRIVIDTVRRGLLVRTTRGAGTLEPENQLQIPAVTSGRVDRRHVVPGQRVEAGQLLLELSNPEVSLELLEAERELARAEMQLVELRSRHELDALSVESEVATLQGDIGEQRRLAEALVTLAESGGATRTEASTASEAYARTRQQVEIAGRRRAVLDSTHAAALVAQGREISRLQRIAQFHRDRVASLRVAVAAPGVVSELSVEQGQWVTSGALLGRLILDGGLKAIVRIPERSAAEVGAGQPAAIDLRGAVVEGVVRRVDPSASGGTVAVEIALPDSLPPGARPDLTVEGTIELGRLPDVLHLARPARAGPNARLGLHRLTSADRAEHVEIETGAVSADRVVVLGGLAEGDAVIVSDLGELASAPTIRLER
jgi:multidrug efflux pump subunit AcrA (membrane-fusion protein)